MGHEEATYRSSDGRLVEMVLYRPTDSRRRYLDQPMLVALPGGPGSGIRYLCSTLDEVGDRAHMEVAYLNLPGPHCLARSGEDAWCWIELLEGIISRLLESRHDKRVVLFGHSFGAFLALMAGIRMQSLNGLILCGGLPAMPNNPLAGFKNDDAGQLAALSEVMQGLAADDEAYRQGWEKFLPLLLAKPDDDETGTMLLGDLGMCRQTHANGLRAIGQFDYRQLLGEVDCSTLVITGDQDRLTPMSAWNPHVPMLTERGWDFSLIPDAGHFPTHENGDFFIEEVVKWLLAR